MSYSGLLCTSNWFVYVSFYIRAGNYAFCDCAGAVFWSGGARSKLLTPASTWKSPRDLLPSWLILHAITTRETCMAYVYLCPPPVFRLSFHFQLNSIYLFLIIFFETNVGLPLGAWAQLGWAIFTPSCMYEMQIFWVVWASNSFRKSFAFTLLQIYANISKRFRLFSMRFTADFNIVFIINYKSVFVIMLTNTHLFCDLYVCMRICSSNNLTLYFMIYFKKF